jgi:outer membrane protein
MVGMGAQSKGRTTGAALAVLLLAVAFPFASALPAFAQAGSVVTMEQCVAQAMASGPDMKLSAANLALAQAKYATTAATNAFGLAGSVEAKHQGAPTNPRFATVGSTTIGTDSAQGGLTLNAPLSTSIGLGLGHTIGETSTPAQETAFSFNGSTTLWDGYQGGSDLANVREAALGLQVTQSTESARQKNVIYSVKQAYYTLLGQQQQLDILRQTLTQREQEMKRTQALLEAQSASQIDLKQAQVNQKQAELDLSKAQRGVEVAREQLSALVGWPLDREYSVAEVADLPAPALEVNQAVTAALAQRDDLKQLGLNLASGEIALALVKGQSTPTVKATGSVTWSYDWAANNLVSPTWSAGLSVAAPIVDAGSNAALVQQAAQSNAALRVQQAQLAASIATNVKNALYGLTDLTARVELAKQSLDLAQAQYDLTRLQFDTGVSSNLDVLTASVAFTAAQVALAAARNSAQLAALALQNAMGQ